MVKEDLLTFEGKPLFPERIAETVDYELSPAEQSLYDGDYTGGTAFVMGSEGEGMRRLTRENCDRLVSLPMLGSVESLNVSVASGVCLYEARRQRLKAS
jgi:tRNA G18 (ribose-2'-O)-methylase SpoU